MSVSRDRLAPGQSRVSTASAFGRIGFLAAAAVLSIPAHPVTAETKPRPAIEAPHRLACLVFDHKSGHCQSNPASAVARSG